MIKRNPDKLKLLLCSVFASETFFLFAPYALYLANAEEFLFTLYHFAFIPLFCFLAAVGILFSAGCLMKKGTGVYCSILFSLGLLTYLQGNFLFEYTGVFNGLPYVLSEHVSHAVSDSLIWIVVIVLCIGLAVCLREKAGYIFTVLSGAFSAVVTLSLMIVLFSSDQTYFKPRDGFVSDRGLLDASRNGDVIVIVPDMFDKTYMDTILAEVPDTEKQFPGFTYYHGAEGCYSSTMESLGAFLKDGNLISAVVENGLSSGIYTDVRFIPDELRGLTVNYLSGPGRINSIPLFIKTLYRLVACAYAPDVLRPAVWLYGNEFESLYSPTDSDDRVYSVSNTGFRSRLAADGINLTEEKGFRFIHIYGAHYPYIHDEFLNPITPSFSDENAVRASRGALSVIGEYLSQLMENDAYRESLIVIMADHGYVEPGRMTDPLVMIKPSGEDRGFTVDSESFSQAELPSRIAELFR